MFVHRYPATEPATQPDHSVSLTPRMWRKLLTQPFLPPRSRVLVVGTRPLDVAELLLDLAYDVSGLCLSPEAVIAGRRQLSTGDFQLWKPGGLDLFFESPFDLILITDFHSGPKNLYDLSSRMETGALLAMLKPGVRCLSLLTEEPDAPHSTHCWQRHFACFPGECETLRLDPAWWWTCRAILRGESRPQAVHVVSFKTPETPISFSEWKDFARAGLFTGKSCCCDTAHQLAYVPAQRRVA